MRRHDVTVGQLHFEAGVGQCLNNRAFKFDDIFLLCQKNPSSHIVVVVCGQKPFSTSVRISTPFAVSATVFS